MKHLLNDLDNSEKNRILEQYNNSLIIETKKFNKLINSKLGSVKPLLNEQGGPNPPSLDMKNLTPEVKKNLWNQISQKPELKQHLEIMPHHTEHNFLEEVGHKLHIHVDPGGKHANVEFPGLGKQHNISVSFGMPYSPQHSTHDSHDAHKVDYSMTPHSYGDVGVKLNFGGNHKKEQPKSLW